MRAALVGAIAVVGTFVGVVRGEDVSNPPILQMFEARWETIERRLPDIHEVGYGSMWVPPVARAGSVFSAGYDVFDRFDLGTPRDETHYGTDSSFRAFMDQANRATVDVYPDLIINHNGFGNRFDPNFVAAGGYPGFALTLPGVDINGDFHDPTIDWLDDPVNGALFGLNDIAQEKNHQFIRHPVDANDPANIPAGHTWNKANPTNTQFYPDRDLAGTTVFDPELNQTVTLYDFNSADPGAGDPVMENATGLLMRNVRWMVQEFGVAGFRVDAAKHSPEFTLDYLDQALFRANQQPQLDGSIKPTYMFSEIADGDHGFVQSFIRRDLPNQNAIDPANTTVGGNRDVLDFPLFFTMRENLTSNGAVNNWHAIRGASIDLHDDGLRNGSQGVAFVQSHDDGAPALDNVGYAYTLMLPGNSLVYLNAEEYGATSFPQPGRGDALGGAYGETLTTLVEIRNSHGRGDFIERWIDDAFDPEGFSNVYIYERGKSAVVGLNSRNDSVVETRTVRTTFEPGTVLIELTGNAADATVDPNGVIPEAVRVDGARQIPVSIPANQGHGKGYVIYGLATPEGVLSVDGSSAVLPGATPSTSTFGTARLADVDVVSADSFTLRLETTPRTLPAPLGETNPVRDVHADGDYAVFKIDGGLDLNGNGSVDSTTPGTVTYGFEEFLDLNQPGYVDDNGTNIGTGFGLYEQVIDTTGLAEGFHYVTARAFRHRDASSGGDGGPAVFTDFKRSIYVDRLPPESELVSFEPFGNSSSDRDLIVGSVDGTAESIHAFLDLPVSITDTELIQMASGGQGQTDYYDRHQFVRGEFDVITGNHVVTLVTFEPSGNTSVKRLPGIYTDTDLGVGAGDLDGDGFIRSNDFLFAGGFEEVLYSQNTQFNPAADANGDGLVDSRDLFLIRDVLIANQADSRVWETFREMVLRRGDLDQSGTTDAADIDWLFANLGQQSWLFDLNSDGVTDFADVETLVEDVFETFFGDANLDGVVDGQDFVLWNDNKFTSTSGWANGDFDGNGTVDGVDFIYWNDFKFQENNAYQPPVALPEPAAPGLFLLIVAGFVVRGRRHAA